VRARRLRLGPALLAEQVVGHLAAPLRVDALRRPGRERDERRTGVVAHARGRHAEHLAEVRVRGAALEDELDDRALVVG
jgi:hypothetical protein